jgi:hypothetical protein
MIIAVIMIDRTRTGERANIIYHDPIDFPSHTQAHRAGRNGRQAKVKLAVFVGLQLAGGEQTTRVAAGRAATRVAGSPGNPRRRSLLTDRVRESRPTLSRRLWAAGDGPRAEPSALIIGSTAARIVAPDC